jgi:hypothetical protein
MTTLRTLATVLLIGGALGLAACEEQKGPAEQIGADIDRAVKETGRAVEDAARDVERAVEDAKN